MSDKHKDEIAISVNNVSKTFKLPHQKQNSLKGMFLNSFKKKEFEVQEALKDVSFEVKKGEFFGIVGRNGSGKSTLLKCMAGVYSPTRGSINVNGSLVPFIELGVGFNPELSGRDNVFLNGALLGFNRRQMLAMYDDIVSFAELERFMDQKLKNYSSGMQVRLAFSIAIRARGDILLLDEVLAVGDEAFRKKCTNYFENLKREKRTVVLVTHDMSSVVNFCNRAMMIKDGKVIAVGDSQDIANQYYKANIQESIAGKAGDTLFNNEDYQVKSLQIMSENNQSVREIKPRKKYKIIAEILIKSNQFKNLGFAFAIRSSGGIPIMGYNSYFDSTRKDEQKLCSYGRHYVEYEFVNNIKNGSYTINAGIHKNIYSKETASYHLEPITILENGLSFVSSGWKPPGVLINSEARVKIK